MTSILTNIAANTALLNLQNTVSNLNDIQNQISTGLKVSSAADNAAYFAIASILRSDSNSLSTVSESLNLGNSSLSVSANALSQIQTTLSDIKSKLVAASQPDANMAAIDLQIKQDQAQLRNISNSANFNGQNFLSIDSAANTGNTTQSFVSSYSRDANGAISIGYINIDASETALFDSNTGGYSPTATGAITTSMTAITASSTTFPAGITGSNPFTVTVANGQLQLTSYTKDAAAPTQYFADTITIGHVSTDNGAPVVNQTLGTGAAANLGLAAVTTAGDTVGGIATGANAPVYDATNHTLTFQVVENDAGNAGKYAYNTYTVSNFHPNGSGGIFDTVDNATVGSYTDKGGTTYRTTDGGAPAGTGVDIMGISLEKSPGVYMTGSTADLAMLNAFQQQVDKAISAVAASASTLGTAQSRIKAQSSFITSLQTSINNGIGAMVDADLNTVSTRLQALQVQQQLGVQSLSIANQSSQMVLKLFQ
jgi:flagellin